MTATTTRFNVSEPQLLGREREYVLDCLERNELSWQGRYVSRFEDAFAEFVGVKHAISCCNGTAALHLSLLALQLPTSIHSSVLLPALTYVATANAVRYCHSYPVFCDVDLATWNISPISVEQKLERILSWNESPVGIIAVHLYGVPAAIVELRKLADKYHLWLVEDAAEAHGATVNGQRVGSFGNIGTFSFYANKLLTCGEGGMLTTDDSELAALARLYRGQGADPHRRYYHSVVGYNYRMTNLQAAIGLAQLENYELHRHSRAQVIDWYTEALAPQFEVQARPQGSVGWMFSVLLPHLVNRDVVCEKLAAEGIETRPVFVPLTELPPYNTYTPSVTKDIADRGINLPTHGGLTQYDVQTICEILKEIVSRS